MKSALMILSALAAASVFATEVVSKNTFGFSQMTGDAGWKIVAVPVAGYDGAGSISVKDILQTSNLTAGDELYTLAAGGGYNKYTLNSDKTDWTPSKTVTIGANGTATATSADSAAVATIARGQAFWLKTNATTVYLMGEGTSGSAGVSVSGAATTGKWNLIGNSNMTTAKAINTISGTKGDVIQLANGTKYMCGGGTNWKLFNPSGTKKYTDIDGTAVIAVGQGFMYQAKASGTISGL